MIDLVLVKHDLNIPVMLDLFTELGRNIPKLMFGLSQISTRKFCFEIQKD